MTGATKVFYRRVGDAIRVHRRAKAGATGDPMPQYELARAVGIVASGVSQIESGQRRPSAELLAKIARVLNVSVADLYPAPIEEHTPV